MQESKGKNQLLRLDRTDTHKHYGVQYSVKHIICERSYTRKKTRTVFLIEVLSAHPAVDGVLGLQQRRDALVLCALIGLAC